MLLTGLIALVVGFALAISTSPSAAADRDCSDFSNQKQAQEFFEKHGPGDPHGLDGDNDGKACETLPCPCASPGSGGGGGKKGGGDKKSKRARVVSVTDGDTIKVRIGKKTRSVRLIGIDTPEVYGGVECGGREASASMKRMLRPGNRVRLTKDGSQDKRDRFGRLLRYVQKGKLDVGYRQVRNGWSKAYVYERRFNRLRKYKRAQRKAKREGRGAWGRCGGRFRTGEVRAGQLPRMTRGDAKRYAAKAFKKRRRLVWRYSNQKKIGPCKRLSRARVRCKAKWHLRSVSSPNVWYSGKVALWYSAAPSGAAWDFTYKIKGVDRDCKASGGGKSCRWTIRA